MEGFVVDVVEGFGVVVVVVVVVVGEIYVLGVVEADFVVVAELVVG